MKVTTVDRATTIQVNTVDGIPFILQEVYNGVILETKEGNQLVVTMRDDTFEIDIRPNGEPQGHWHRVDMQKVEVHRYIPDSKSNSA